MFISIPTGPIEGIGVALGLRFNYAFQFLLVRLKANEWQFL